MLPLVRRTLRVLEIPRILVLGAIAVAVGLLAACGGDGATEPAPPSVAFVAVSPSAFSLVPNQTRELTATPRDGNGSPLSGRVVTWSADQATVVTVNGSGVVTAQGPGTTTIRATSEGREGTATVTVNDGGFVGAAGGIVTAAGGDVVLTVPAGSLTTGTALTVAPLSSPPAHPRLIAGTGYELGPSGTTFAQPVTVQIAYAQGSLGGADEDQLAVHRWDGQAWMPLENDAVDTGANTASGQTSQFSPFAVIEIVPNPVPMLASLDPTSAEEGGAAFTLTVTGTGFVEGSVVRWNGESRTTTFQSATTLMAQITAVDIATAGQAAVTVFSPALGGGTTDPLAFPILPPSTTFTVTTTANEGPGSLRQAILDANANPGADLIHFNIPGASGSPYTIRPTSPLPAITDPVTIDGLTQPGADCSTWPATLRIELDGTSVGVGTNGLVLSGGSSTVRGLVINRFDGGAGIRIDSDQNAIECNYLGSDVTGMLPIGTPFDQSHFGVHIDGGDNNIIGGATPSKRNLISNNDDDGVFLHGGATGNVIAGNFIGTTVTGSASLRNDQNGVLIVDAQGTIVGGPDHDAGVCNHSCNLISGNFEDGIRIDEAGGDGAVIQGNFIGTDITGTVAILNDRVGIIVDRGMSSTGTSGHLIGGASDPGVCSRACNLISGNDNEGIRIDDNVLQNITVQGNFIGTDITGMAALPNGQDGMTVRGVGHQIGGATPGLGNLISGNSDTGLDFSTLNSVVEGNMIGTAIDGASPLGNGKQGILVSRADNRIGGTVPGEGNTIAYNAGDGVFHGIIIGPPGNGRNAILGNSIFANGGLGINLCVTVNFQCDGVTPNDPGDTDTGPNNLQNYPVLSAATLTDTLSVTGALNSTASTTFRVEFFANDALDPSGHGEGQTYLGFLEVTTDADGNADFQVTLPSTGVVAGAFINAHAPHSAGSTSEFSAGIVVQ